MKMKGYDIELRNISKIYNKNTVLNNINLTVKQGEFFTLLGPSGSGKTTTLRIIMGFVYPTSGDVLIRNEIVTDRLSNERNIGIVFQNYALFPHLTVFHNIAFPLEIRKYSSEYIKEQVESLLEIIDLQGYENRYPRELSGGEQQRVALARALVFRPILLLLDEPLAALDRQLRDKMRMEIKNIQKILKTTTIYVTHDQEEALFLSDRIAVIKNGKLEQIGTPEELYNHPNNIFVANFIGESNIFSGTLFQITNNNALVKLDSGIIIHIFPTEEHRLGQRVWISIRPERIEILKNNKNCFSGTVTELLFKGSYRRIIADVDGTLFKIYIHQPVTFIKGDIVSFSFKPEDCSIIKGD